MPLPTLLSIIFRVILDVPSAVRREVLHYKETVARDAARRKVEEEALAAKNFASELFKAPSEPTNREIFEDHLGRPMTDEQWARFEAKAVLGGKGSTASPKHGILQDQSLIDMVGLALENGKKCEACGNATNSGTKVSPYRAVDEFIRRLTPDVALASEIKK